MPAVKKSISFDEDVWALMTSIIPPSGKLSPSVNVLIQSVLQSPGFIIKLEQCRSEMEKKEISEVVQVVIEQGVEKTLKTIEGH